MSSPQPGVDFSLPTPAVLPNALSPHPNQQKFVSRNQHVRILADRLSIAFGSEALGAFFLVGGRIWAGNNVGRIPAVGCIYILILIFCAHHSGAYCNPGLTLAGWIRGKIPTIIAISYALIQLVFGILGGLFAHYVILDHDFVPGFGHAYFTMAHQPYIGYHTLFVYEFIYCFWFTYVFLMLTSTWMSRHNQLYIVYLGAFLITCMGVTSTVSPGLMNPAITIGCLIPAAAHFGTENIKSAWIYLLAEFAANIVGAVIFVYVSKNDLNREFRESTHKHLHYKPY